MWVSFNSVGIKIHINKKLSYVKQLSNPYLVCSKIFIK